MEHVRPAQFREKLERQAEILHFDHVTPSLPCGVISTTKIAVIKLHVFLLKTLSQQLLNHMLT